MNSFKAYFHKEILESVRKNKYLILGVGFVFWAILNPLMLKLMPYFIKGQVPDVLLSELAQISKLEAIQNYMGDVFSIGLLFTVFSLMGLLADEIESKRLVLPYAAGVNPGEIVLAKFLHYTLSLSLFILLGFLVNYYYVDIFFTGEMISFNQLLPAAVLFMVYYMFIISLILLFSSLFKTTVPTGISVLILSFGMSYLQNLQYINIYLPYNLIAAASRIEGTGDNSLWTTIIITVFLIIILNYTTVYRMQKVEVV
ncbi:MAG: ABC transporter permease [Halanaerobiaceae bacterium]